MKRKLQFSISPNQYKETKIPLVDNEISFPLHFIKTNAL